MNISYKLPWIWHALFFLGANCALVLLPKLINIVLNKNTTSQVHLDHVKHYKSIIESIPSSALVQIAPVSLPFQSILWIQSNLTCYQNLIVIFCILGRYRCGVVWFNGKLKTPAELSPIFPFLLWTTSDFESGKIFLKIDKKSFLVADCAVDNDALVRAFELSVKAHHVFLLEYHPYLKSVYVCRILARN